MRRRKALQKSIKLYISKLKRVSSNLHLPNTPSSTAAATSRLLSACKYPKTPSFSHHHGSSINNQSGGLDSSIANQAATLSDVDRFLYENFQSLYLDDDDDDKSVENDCEMRRSRGAILSSGRFFVSPGTSNSLLDETRPSNDSSSSSSSSLSSVSSSLSKKTEAVDAGNGVAGDSGGVAVTTFSKDPYDDFRRSMQDMVDARHVDPLQPLDWDFMEELLFCYLELNDRSVHRYVLKAFSDLAVSFRRRFPAEGRRVPSVDTNGMRGRRANESRRSQRSRSNERPQVEPPVAKLQSSASVTISRRLPSTILMSRRSRNFSGDVGKFGNPLLVHH